MEIRTNEHRENVDSISSQNNSFGDTSVFKILENPKKLENK